MVQKPIKTIETKEDLIKFFEEVRKTAFISYDTESVGYISDYFFPETVIGLSNGNRYVVNEKTIDREKE